MKDVALAPGMRLYCYETLLAEADEDYSWPEFDENTASALCYTSGTTGQPKGVLYSHRATMLHTYAGNSAEVFGIARSIACCLPRRCITPAHGVCPIAQPWWARRSFCRAGISTALLSTECSKASA